MKHLILEAESGFLYYKGYCGESVAVEKHEYPGGGRGGNGISRVCLSEFEYSGAQFTRVLWRQEARNINRALIVIVWLRCTRIPNKTIILVFLHTYLIKASWHVYIFMHLLVFKSTELTGNDDVTRTEGNGGPIRCCNPPAAPARLSS